MRHAAIPAELFLLHRQRLQALLPPASVAIITNNDLLPRNADGLLPLVPSSDLFYLTGIEQEETILVLAPDAADETLRTLVFLRQPDPLTVTFDGEKLSAEQATRLSGITGVHWLSEFPVIVHKLLCEMELVYLNSNEHVRAVVEVETRAARFAADLMKRYPLHQYRRLARLLHELRVVKSPGEVALMRQACAITRMGFLRVLQEVRPGMNECEVEALYAYEFTRNRGFFAYNPIVASGLSACTLHYNRNDQLCRDGDLLLLDVASSYANYNADLTRTIPVNGRYTPRQRQVYDAVLRIQKALIARARPGTLWRDWQRAAEDLATSELAELGLISATARERDQAGRSPCKPYFMHGIGHPIGLDVHDVGHLKTPFAVGWALTVEPGFYIPEEGMGIRIEDIIVITEDGHTNLMDEIPKEADVIEELLARRAPSSP